MEHVLHPVYHRTIICKASESDALWMIVVPVSPSIRKVESKSWKFNENQDQVLKFSPKQAGILFHGLINPKPKHCLNMNAWTPV